MMPPISAALRTGVPATKCCENVFGRQVPDGYGDMLSHDISSPCRLTYASPSFLTSACAVLIQAAGQPVHYGQNAEWAKLLTIMRHSARRDLQRHIFRSMWPTGPIIMCVRQKEQSRSLLSGIPTRASLPANTCIERSRSKRAFNLLQRGSRGLRHIFPHEYKGREIYEPEQPESTRRAQRLHQR